MAHKLLQPRLVLPSTLLKDTLTPFQLLWSVVVSLLFIGIRLIYTLAIFVSDKKALDPNHGSLAERVVLTLIPELITLVIFIVAGLLTRNVKQDADVRSRPHHFGKKQQELEVDSSVV